MVIDRTRINTVAAVLFKDSFHHVWRLVTTLKKHHAVYIAITFVIKVANMLCLQEGCG